jgi:hypothetical protein
MSTKKLLRGLVWSFFVLVLIPCAYAQEDEEFGESTLDNIVELPSEVESVPAVNQPATTPTTPVPGVSTQEDSTDDESGGEDASSATQLPPVSLQILLRE